MRKVVYFRSQPEMQKAGGECRIAVERGDILQQSFDALAIQATQDLKRKLMVVFLGEPVGDDDTEESKV